MRWIKGIMEISIAVCAIIIAAAGVFFAIWTFREERNAALVQIGVAVLRADPTKEKQVNAAREWALDLIDANAGGVKFSKTARAQLLLQPLTLGMKYFGDFYREGGGDAGGGGGEGGGGGGGGRKPRPAQ